MGEVISHGLVMRPRQLTDSVSYAWSDWARLELKMKAKRCVRSRLREAVDRCLKQLKVLPFAIGCK